MPRTAERRLPDLRPLLSRTAAPFVGLAPAERETLLSAAARHGLLAAVSGRLPPDDPGLRARFERLAVANRLRDARLRQVLDEVLGVLAAAGLAPVALKGPALADRVYPEPALRAATDLDLLVEEEDLPRAVAALVEVGFSRAPEIQDAYQRSRHHHLHLGRVPAPDVELHFRAASAFGSAIPTAELRARARPHRTAGGAVLLVLAPEDELIALSVHAAAHLVERGGWLLDLALLLERVPELDWEAVRARAEAWRCLRVMSYVLDLLRVAGAPVPAGALPPLGPKRRRLIDRLARGALGAPGPVASVLRMGFRSALRDRVLGLASALLGEVAWAARRRAHLFARRLTHSRTGRGDVGPTRSSRKPSNDG